MHGRVEVFVKPAYNRVYMLQLGTMKNSIKFVYFDIGGVFLRWREMFEAIAVKIGKTETELMEVFGRYDDLACKGDITSNELWEKMKNELGLEKTKDDFDDFMSYSIESFTVIPETHEFAKEVSSHFPIGLLSNVHTGVYELVRGKGLIPDLPYKVAIRSCDIGMAKPEPPIYRYAQKQAGVSASSILFTDDIPVNIEAAQKLGWQGVVFDTDQPEKSIREIRKILAMS